MAAIITEKFRTHNARQFIEDFTEESQYVFIGRPHSWTDDNNPPAPANSESEEISAYEDMIALKKVASTDVSHGLVRYNWDSTHSTKYDEYRDDYSSTNTSNVTGASNFFDARGYVITEDFRVYKCLRTGVNSSGVAVNSTVKPDTTSSTIPQITSDTGATHGYMWKFMYSIGASDVIKFVTNDFIPVKTIGAKSGVAGSGTNGQFGSTATDDSSAQWDVENGSVDGAIYHYVVTAAGSGYNNGSSGTFDFDVNIEGDGSGAVATLSFESGALKRVQRKDTSSFGSGYKRASHPTLASALSGLTAGTGATFKPIISPINGHGANPLEELGGNYVIVNSRLEFGEGSGDFPTDNDFRRIGLIKNPVQSSDSTISTEASLTATNQVTVDNATSLTVDDVITNAASESATTAKARIVSKTGNVLKLLPVVNSGGEYVNFANSNSIFKDGSDTSVDVSSSGVSSAHPEMTRFTGQILYVENRGAVSRAADQIEDIKLIIEM
tara:strand:- start:4444 stop:5934 length:1491 start_codon:yes stop_codon:yes gene_type:complete